MCIKSIDSNQTIKVDIKKQLELLRRLRGLSYNKG